MNKLARFLARVFSGEDIILVPQTGAEWERQFAAGTWDRLQGGQANTDEIARRILAYAETTSARVRVLDVGCGNGGLARRIVHAVDYTGIDIAPAAITAARAVAPEGEFIVADAMHPPATLGMYDVLVCNEVLYYLDPRTLLMRYRAHVVADARVYISVVRFWRSWFIWRRIKQRLQLTERFSVSDASRRWDIAVGHFI